VPLSSGLFMEFIHKEITAPLVCSIRGYVTMASIIWQKNSLRVLNVPLPRGS
jgi:hypothetical protein